MELSSVENGFRINFSAVSSGRFQYPEATPSPPIAISPIVPDAAAWPCSFNK